MKVSEQSSVRESIPRPAAGSERFAPTHAGSGKRFQSLLDKAIRASGEPDSSGTTGDRPGHGANGHSEELPTARRCAASRLSDLCHDTLANVPEEPIAPPLQRDLLPLAPCSEFTGSMVAGSSGQSSTALVGRLASIDQPEPPSNVGPQRANEGRSALTEILAHAALHAGARIELHMPKLGRVAINHSNGRSGPRIVVGIDHPSFEGSASPFRSGVGDALPGMSETTAHTVVILRASDERNHSGDRPSRSRQTDT